MKSGFIALIGRPNVGKSSFLNYVIGEKISIVSSKVQTTRRKILGIYNFPNNVGQIVFIDLPGIHNPLDELGKTCLTVSQSGAKEADLILFMVESFLEPWKDDKAIYLWLKENCSKIPIALVLNKADLVKSEFTIKEYKNLFSDITQEVFLISAKTGMGIEKLLDYCKRTLPEGEQFYPESYLTDQTMRFLCSELIREQVLNELDEEVPHSIAVTIEEYVEKTQANGIVKIKAIIYVERDSQKGIVIGKNGSKIKQIGTKARIEIEKLINSSLFLELKVKLLPKWRKNTEKVKKLL